MIEQHTTDNLPVWRDFAACADTDLDWFNMEIKNVHKLVAVCAECPVKAECLESSMHPHYEHFGVWGGMRPESRRLLRRRDMTALRASKAKRLKAFSTEATRKAK